MKKNLRLMTYPFSFARLNLNQARIPALVAFIFNQTTIFPKILFSIFIPSILVELGL